MADLVALDLPGGPAFVRALRDAWDAGDAVLPVDQRLPAPARAQLLEAARPAVIVGPDGVRTPAAAEPVAVDAGDALVIATSGTSGVPRLIVHTRDGLEAHARAVHTRLDVDPASDRWLACLPLAHIGGLGVVIRSILTDTPFDVLPGFDHVVVAASPRNLGTTLVSLVATALDRLDPAPFRWVVLGGSADPVDRPAHVLRTYGLTESGGGVVYEGVPLTGAEVRVDADGAIALRGPMLARGRREADGTATPLTDDDGWLATGDLGAWEDERLVVSGRADDVIITGAEKVFPDAVEAVLLRHPAVAEVAVVGRPDPEWGSRVTAVVVPADATAPPTLDALRDHVRASLPAYAAPRELVLAGVLPRTALGKIRRSELR